MTLLGQAYFYVCAVLAILGALGVVIAKNPIRGAMGLLLMILSIAGVFLALHAQFLAAIQLIVYAGAIVVLFLFVIMLLGPSASTPTDRRGRIPRIVAGALFAAASLGAGVAVFLVASKSAPPADAGALLPTPPNDFGSVDAFGKILFTQGLLPFELSSALLMVAIVGAVAVARGRAKHEIEHKSPEALLRADAVPLADPKGAPRSPGGITREA
jgi:NADH-quinone oxidoreductase subunit J